MHPLLPDLTIRIKRGTDGSVVLSCTRADGSTTWQRQTGATARFFPFHDLTHLAAETVLGEPNGFYGLVASGWDIGDFGTPWPRGPLPPVASDLELLIGFLDAERAAAEQWDAGELHQRSRLSYEARGASPPASAPSVTTTDAQLDTIRARRDAFFAQWRAVLPGGALELPFP